MIHLDLVKGFFIKRYKRFLVDVRMEDGSIITAHCPNTGSMKTCLTENGEVWLSKAPPGHQRKYPYTLEITTQNKEYVGVHTGRTNLLAKMALEKGLIPEVFYPDEPIRTEVTFGKTRSDFFWKDTWIEVKHVTYVEDRPDCKGRVALFPDAISERGQKHLQFLMDRVIQDKQKALMLFLIHRSKPISYFQPAWSIDLVYGKLLSKAKDKGVLVLAYMVDVSPKGLNVTSSVEVLCQQPS